MGVGQARYTAAIGVILISATGCGSSHPSPSATTTPAAVPYSFNNVKCIPAEAVQDSGNSLAYDFTESASPSEDDFAHTYTIECIKMVTQLPDYVFTQMEQTSALQGRQAAEWNVDVSKIPEAQVKVKPMANATLEASWTYHPDNGLDVIIRIK